MRRLFYMLALILLIAGFFVPFAWIGSIICLLIGVASAPPGRRIDGKLKTGGLFGGIIDDIAVSRNTRRCPYCKELIIKDAIKCRHCGSELSQAN